jgi:hypothetical protein
MMFLQLLVLNYILLNGKIIDIVFKYVQEGDPSLF